MSSGHYDDPMYDMLNVGGSQHLWELTQMNEEFSHYNGNVGFNNFDGMSYGEHQPQQRPADLTFDSTMSSPLPEPYISDISPSAPVSSSLPTPRSDPFRMSLQMYRPQSREHASYVTEPFRKYQPPPILR